jgi:phage baseplate assembly protein W
MRTLQIVNGDIVFNSQRNLVMVEGHDEEIQSIERLLTTNTGEWFLNIEHGLDYSRLQGKAVSDEQIRLAVLQALAQEGRITEVESIEIRRSNKYRTVVINFRCRMVSGETLQGEEVLSVG